MLKRRIDSVAAVGAATALLSLAFGYVQYRPNRIANGTSIPVWHVATPVQLILLGALLILIVLNVLRVAGGALDARRCALRGIFGNLLIILIFLITATNAQRLIPHGQQFARISFAPGLWIATLGGYLLILSALREMKAGTSVRLLTSLLAVVALIAFAASGVFDHLSIWQEYVARRDRFVAQFGVHMSLSLGATGLALLIGLPLGVWAFRRNPAERPIFVVVNTVQTIPSLALFGLLIAPLAYLSRQVGFLRTLGIEGIGWAPALIALTLYALLPITRNTFTSLKILDPAIIDAGRGMGMSRRQVLLRVEIPLAAPVILGGIRTSLVQAIGNTTVAALIGAGGFGTFIFQGLGQAVPDMILLGTIPVIALAVAVDKGMELLIRLITPRGLQRAAEQRARGVAA